MTKTRWRVIVLNEYSAEYLEESPCDYSLSKKVFDVLPLFSKENIFIIDTMNIGISKPFYFCHVIYYKQLHHNEIRVISGNQNAIYC